MKIAIFLVNSDHYSGGTYYAYEVASGLTMLGHEVTMYVNKIAPFVNDFKYYGRLHHVVNKDIEQGVCKDVCADLYIGFPVPGTWLAEEMGMKFNKPAISFVFDSLPDLKRSLTPEEYQREKNYFSKIQENIKNKALHLVTCSKYTKKGVMEWVGRKDEEISVLHPCVNSEAMKHTETDETDYGILFISRMVKRKRYDDLLYIAERIETRLNIVSSNFEEDFTERFRACRNIKLFRAINDERKFGLLQKCKAVVSTSQFEGFGMYAIEAYAMGKTLIAKDLPTFKEMYEPQYRYVYKNNDDLIRAINAIGDRKQKPNTNYDFDKFTERLSLIINKVCK